jgi:hypothetical protein
MKREATYEKLMEMFIKVNPELVTLNEIVGAATAPVVGGDVKAAAKETSMASGVQSANKRIDTPMEFPQAFMAWFQSLGYDPQNNAISTSKVLTDVRNAMQQMGYK